MPYSLVRFTVLFKTGGDLLKQVNSVVSFANVLSANCQSKQFKTKYYAENSHSLDMEAKTKTVQSNIGLLEQEIKANKTT